MPLFGAVVVRVSDRLVLCQSTASEAADIPATAWADLISKCSAPRFRQSVFGEFEPGRRVGIHVCTDDEFGVGIFSDEHCPRKVAHAALDEGIKLFRKMFVEAPSKLTPKTVEVFKKPLADVLAKYHGSDAVTDEKVKKVRAAVDEVKELALDNVERVLARGQHIDEIVQQTDELQSQAAGFQRNSKMLKNQMWWNNMKGKLIIAGVILVFLLVVYVVFCGGLSCSSGGSSSSDTTAAPV